MSIMKNYEISIWNDIQKTRDFFSNSDSTKHSIDYFDEELKAIIGSSETEGEIYAHEPKLVTNVNGSHTLTFSMFYKYYNKETGQLEDNPYIQYLSNEQKIKLRREDKWYDLVIKKIEESTDKKTCIYTCKDLFINELSKNGYNLEFDTELENNQGTAIELAKKVVKGTNWRVNEAESEIPIQYIEEPLLKARLHNHHKQKITATIMAPENLKENGEKVNGKTIQIYGLVNNGNKNELRADGEQFIYIFYSSFKNQEKKLQFIYSGDYNPNKYPKDDDRVILTETNLYIEIDSWDDGIPKVKHGDELISFIDTPVLSDEYRGKRIVWSPKTTYDNSIGKSVSIYKKGNTELYGYIDKESITSETVKNYIVNSQDFSSTNGWKIAQYAGLNSKETDHGNISVEWDSNKNKAYLKWANGGGSILYNTGFSTNRKKIHNLLKDEEYVFEFLIDKNATWYSDYSNSTNSSYHCHRGIRVEIQEFDIGENGYVPKIPGLFDFGTNQSSGYNNLCFKPAFTTSNGNFQLTKEDKIEGFGFQSEEEASKYYVMRCIAKCSKTLSYKELLEKNIGIFITTNRGNKFPRIFGMRFYKKITTKKGDNDNYIITPGVTPTAQIKNIYKIYNPNIYPNNIATSEDELHYEYIGDDKEQLSSYVVQYDNTYAQVHSIKAKESNRFNIIQNICESFEVWARFDTEHNSSTGLIPADWLLLKTEDILPSPYKKYYKRNNDSLKFCSQIMKNISGNFSHKDSEGEMVESFAVGLNLLSKDLNIFDCDSNGVLLNNIGGQCYFKLRNINTGNILMKSNGEDFIFTMCYGGYINAELINFLVPCWGDGDPLQKINIPLYNSSGNLKSNWENYEIIIDSTAWNIVSFSGTGIKNEEGVNVTSNYLQCPGSQMINFSATEDYYEIKYMPHKYILFKEFIGQEQYAGFKYGINLNTIQRSVDSDSIVTKIIVKNNANEHGKNGFCSIARAKSNMLKENFAYDFRYYVNQGLLNREKLYTELHGNNGLFIKIANINDGKNDLIEKRANLAVLISQLEADVQTYQASYEAAADKYLESMADFKAANNGEEYNPTKDYSDSKYEKLMNKYGLKITTYISQKENFFYKLKKAKEQLGQIKQEYNTVTGILSKKSKNIESLCQAFFDKYSRYIQEGSWIDEKYMDDDLYYYEAVNVLATSAMPKISYTFKVIDVSCLPGYNWYSINVGDKTYVEDVEYFGYKADGITPYHEEVVVSEITEYLRQPEKTEVKIQNYKTQFEDLFQRIAAATQSLQFHEGEYVKTSNYFTPEGTISTRALQNSMNAANWILSHSKDQSVVWDNEGISVTSATDLANRLRIVNRGIVMSTDGGETWKLAISGEGINASFISTGQLDTDKIRVMNGNDVAFFWDYRGINAYDSDGVDEDGTPKGFVRFDKFGIYGIEGIGEPAYTTADAVQKNSRFSVTWKGLRINDKSGNKVFFADDNGNLEITGVITATGGNIGGWQIKDMTLNPGNGSTSKKGLYVGDMHYLFPYNGGNHSGSAVPTLHWGEKFKVYGDGYLVAENAQIIGSITANSLTLGNSAKNTVKGVINDDYIKQKLENLGIDPDKVITTNDYETKLYPVLKEEGYMILAKDYGSPDTTKKYFMVSKEGLLTAYNAVIWGTIHAGAGEIGSWSINNKYIESKAETESGATVTTNWFSISSAVDTNNNDWIHAGTRVTTNGSVKSTSYNFKVTKTGEMHATAGTIGGWTISSAHLRSGNGMGNSNTIYLCPAGSINFYTIGGFYKKNWCITVGNIFGVHKTDGLYVTSGNIGGWGISSEGLYYGTMGTDGGLLLYPTGKSTNYSLAGALRSSICLAIGKKFGVDKYGNLYCSNARITGTIYAKGGEVGGWSIQEGYLRYPGSGTSDDNGALAFRPKNAGISYKNKGVYGDGNQGYILSLYYQGQTTFFIDGQGVLRSQDLVGAEGDTRNRYIELSAGQLECYSKTGFMTIGKYTDAPYLSQLNLAYMSTAISFRSGTERNSPGSHLFGIGVKPYGSYSILNIEVPTNRRFGINGDPGLNKKIKIYDYNAGAYYWIKFSHGILTYYGLGEP